jgi:hypothetical protein
VLIEGTLEIEKKILSAGYLSKRQSKVSVLTVNPSVA